MRLTKAQSDAAWCWHYSSKVKGSVFDGTLAGSITGKIDAFMGGSKIDSRVTREDVIKKCDELLLTNDPSVQVMVLKALFLLSARTRHVGFVAALLASQEVGMNFLYPSITMCRFVDRPMDTKDSVSREAQTYLYFLLDLKETNLSQTLQEKNRHWVGCLEMHRINDDGSELQDGSLELEERNRETLMWARNDINSYLESVVYGGYCQRKEQEVYEDIKAIVRYVLVEDIPFRNPTHVLGAVLYHLSWLAARGHFSERRLVEIVNDIAQHNTFYYERTSKPVPFVI